MNRGASTEFGPARVNNSSGDNFSPNANKNVRCSVPSSSDQRTTIGHERILLNVREVAQLTGLSVGTLYAFVSQHRIPVVRISSRCIRFELSAIREWIESLSEPAASD